MRRSGASFDPAATLRKFAETGGVLDGLLQRVRRRWEALEEHPAPAELALLQHDLEAATAQLASLWTLLGGGFPGGGHGSQAPAVLPIPWGPGQSPSQAEPAAGAPDGPSKPTTAEPRERGRDARTGADSEAGAGAPAASHPAAGEEPMSPPEGGPNRSRGSDGESAGQEDAGPTRNAPRTDGPSAPEFPLYRDPETGVLTREGFDALASGELKRSRRHGRPFTLLLFRAPPVRGDELRGAAATVRRDLREFDLLGRHAPELLAVGLPETPAEGGRVVARRVGAVLSARREPWDDASLPGIASHPEDGESLLGLLDAARRRLGEGPTGGRTAEGPADGRMPEGPAGERTPEGPAGDRTPEASGRNPS